MKMTIVMIAILTVVVVAGCARNVNPSRPIMTNFDQDQRFAEMDAQRPKLKTPAELAAHIRGRADASRGIWSTRGLHSVGEYDAYVWAHNYELWRLWCQKQFRRK